MGTKTTKTFAQHAEHAALDLQGREGISRFDRLNKLSNEVEIGEGFIKVDTDADPAHCAVESDEDAGLRHVADFYIRNHWSPEAAAEMAAEREEADHSFKTILEEVA